MSWRAGSTLFIKMWPQIQKNMPDEEFRILFTADLLKLFARWDMDTYEVEDIHPDIRAAMRKAKIKLTEPERYKNDT